MDDMEKIAAALAKVAEAAKDLLNDLAEVVEAIEITEPEKYEPCLRAMLPFSEPRCCKLWRKNRAIFRPYKRAPKIATTTKQRRASYELF